jgi:tellurite resistance protein
MALAKPDHSIDRDKLIEDERILETSKRMKGMNKSDFIRIVQEQSRILQVDEDSALKALATLIQGPQKRREALEIVRQVMLADKNPSAREKFILEKIRGALDLKLSRAA